LFIPSPSDSPAVQYQAAVKFLGGYFENYLNDPANAALKQVLVDRLASGPVSGAIDLSDFALQARSLSLNTVQNEAGLNTSGGFMAALENTVSLRARFRAAEQLDGCLGCSQDLSDAPNKLFEAASIVSDVAAAKSLTMLGARGIVAGAEKIAAARSASLLRQAQREAAKAGEIALNAQRDDPFLLEPPKGEYVSRIEGSFTGSPSFFNESFAGSPQFFYPSTTLGDGWSTSGSAVHSTAAEFLPSTVKSTVTTPWGTRDFLSGKFSVGPRGGIDPVDDFIAQARANGYEVIGREISVLTPFEMRRVDVVIRNPTTGATGGIELKSSDAEFRKFKPEQFSADEWINRFGARTTGQNARAAGIRNLNYVVKILWPPPN
jgi:hypothetical protein